MSLRIRYAKYLRRNIDKHEAKLAKFYYYISQVKKWIKEDKKRLNNQLNKLSYEEILKYGYQVGFIDDIEFNKLLEKKQR